MYVRNSKNNFVKMYEKFNYFFHMKQRKHFAVKKARNCGNCCSL